MPSHLPINPDPSHTTVLLREAVEAMVWNKDGIYIDGTFGRGGHSRHILQHLSEKGRLIAFDRDQTAVAIAQTIEDDRFTIVHGAFAQLQEKLTGLGITKVDGVLLDLGVSSPQLDVAQRGFSFRFEGPLDMRMDQSQGLTAYEWLETVTEDQLIRVIRDFGEERFASKIAKTIIHRRQQHALPTTTKELAEVIASCIPFREKGQHPATRTFQALRIYINQELAQLEEVLEQAVDVLVISGRLVVISFHSLEDRIVKSFIRVQSGQVQATEDTRQRYLPVPSQKEPRLINLGKTKPSEHEIHQNPRARSAVMRVAQRVQHSEVGRG